MHKSTFEKVFKPLVDSMHSIEYVGVRVPSVFMSSGEFAMEKARAPTKNRLDKT